MLRIKVISIIVVILLASGCGNISSLKKNDGQFEVRVLSSSSGLPVAGATIVGGLDWTAFEVKTNDEGIALLPDSARGEWAGIHKNNFFPYHLEVLSPTNYFITPTPKQFKLIGDISGWGIRFDSGTLITVDYQGGYHLYSYNDQGITEIASAQLPTCIRETQLHGNRLWFSTHDDGIYVYSLEDPFHPVQLFHLAIPGYLGSFALKDSIIVVGNPWDNDSVRVFTYSTNGDFQEIGRFGNHFIGKMAFIGNYLVIVNYYDCLPAIYDLQDPANPCLVYKGVESEYWYGFLFRSYLVLIPNLDFIDETTIYKLIDLSDPAHPATLGFFSADSKLFEIVDERIAIGRYYLWTGAISVLIGDINQGFKTIAIITDHPWVQVFLHESEGCAPPYFIIGERLWKLED